MKLPVQRRWGAIPLLAISLPAGACSLAGLDAYSSGSEGGSGGSGGAPIGGQGGSGGGAGSCAGEGQKTCGEQCVDTRDDPAHCGACDLACAPGYDCLDGVCGNHPIGLSVHFASCVVLRGGKVWCWGRNAWGELGVPSAETTTTCPYQSSRCRPAPLEVAGISDAVEVVTNREITCARTAAGEVFCWGSNDKGRLGHDPALDATCEKAVDPPGTTGPCTATPTKVALPAGAVAVQISVGNAATCARTATRDVYCWGQNGDGEIKAPPGGFEWQPTKNANVNGDADDVSVGNSLGGVSTVCVTQSGTGQVRCWGQSFGGAVFPTSGVGGCANGDVCDPVAHTVPKTFASTSMPVIGERLDAGYLTACALRQGTLSCWGDDRYGQSGLGAASPGANHFDPVAISGVPAVVGFSSRFLTTLALGASGSVWSLGWGDEGQLGDGTFGSEACPGSPGQHCQTTAKQIAGLTGVALVATGPNSSGAVTREGKVYMWGANYNASLGHAPFTGGDVACGQYPCSAVPVRVEGLP